PQLLFINGRIHSLNPGQAVASVLLIRGGRVAYLGDDPAAGGLARRGVETIDLPGACVLPGLTDAHLHLQWYAEGLAQVQAEQPRAEDVLAEVGRRAAELPEGAWITGYGWDHNAWGGELPSAAMLDACAPLHPVRLMAKSGHALWVNSAALHLADINSATLDPDGGQIVHTPAGDPSGILLENAMQLIKRIIPPATPASLLPAMRRALALLARAGLTGVHNMDGAAAFAAEQMLLERGELALRIVQQIPLAQLDQSLALGLRSGYGSDRLRIGAVKMFMDGALGPRTAWMLAPYESEPRTLGIETTPITEIYAAVARANAGGLACAIHAIGDRAVRQVLDAYEAGGALGIRNRIEHVQLIDEADLPRLAKLGVIASMQPLHATSDMLMADRHWGARCANAYAWRALQESGAVLAFGSDCPVETPDPLRGLHAAITRRRADGSPGEQGWYPAQRLTPEQALCAYTSGPAYAAGVEGRLGTLAPGKLADLTILERDPFTCDPAELPHTAVLGALVEMEFAWRDPGLVGH
ncbi:MAG: amidohydrolase, partial [Chloroflexi bacterium]|nr:amidohydrolase [Chloroflexota bacterium]